MIKKFIHYYKPHIKLFLLDILCALFMAVADLAFPMVTKDIVNNVIPNRMIKLLYIYVLILVVLYVLKLICNYVVDYWGHVVGVRMQYDMRKDLFAHLQTLPFSYFDDTKTGHIMSRMINDLRDVSELAHHGPEDLFISTVMIFGSFIILCTVNWQLTLIIFAFMPILIWFAIKKRVKMSEAFKVNRKKIAVVNAQLENSISGIRVAKSFTNEEYEKQKFDEGNREFKEARENAFKTMAEFSSGMRFMLNILNVIVLFAGGLFLYYHKINLGELLAYFLYINFFMQPVRRLTSFVEQYQLGMTGFERFIEIMNIKPDIIDDADAIELKNVKGDIEFRNVTFNYNENHSILRNLSFKVGSGKTLALVGPSGGGKTTICHLIPRFYEISEGEILIDGINIRNVTLKSLRKNIGIVQQEVFLFTGTIKENILYGKPGATDDEIIEAAKNANIHDFILSLPEGYDTYIGERGVKLSGGQKQRISIARVFLKNPPILILDEATSALDNNSEIIIQKSLEKLSKERTTLVVAHRLSTIVNADEILVLTNEGIKERGSHDELIEREGIYAQLFNAQFKGYIPDFA
ncbi:putative multidrug export ATP-binding/permease protein [Clostridium tepidiprofundi DSM 19306]|uniref:Putative multidrug export ATP-binding/permease protein n=1 Tax=Clostridium tepidiprofundi DSM 19306 TaxID=1121338 RepID=A0A151B682_9CLOT|nr:ABC transporter ATP-binding protein [Clostridium tepidiprofundi]KYH35157.1 putative multidrug export ATP-binding/permease protein [Clostridium tepidiprofundi DSM 19306]